MPPTVTIGLHNHKKRELDTVEVILSQGISGIIATNTTIERPAHLRNRHSQETGGLSGKPLTLRSTEVIRSVYRQTEGKLPIIGVGGIFNGQDAYNKIRAGASLVQIYTALIYKGPSLVKDINLELSNLLQRDGFTHIHQAVGVDA